VAAPWLPMPCSNSPSLLLTATSAASAMHMLAMLMSAHEWWPGVSMRLMCCWSNCSDHSLGVIDRCSSRSSFVLSEIQAKRRAVWPAALAAASTASNVSSGMVFVSRSKAPTNVDLPHCEWPATTKQTCCLA
jgi:hypothetical protein